MAETVHLTVTGMTCGGCENAVTRAVGQLAGVTKVTASHAADAVDVTYESETVTPEMIRERIKRLGYRVGA
jgi:copper chaperone CopZ